jgi:[acyl-carrier-protein] S-malonyltransferase
MKIGMLFPDYGSQYVGMGKELYDSSRIMQEYFEEASTCLDVNFVKLCFASSEQELAQIHNAATSIFLLSCAISALLKEKGVVPTVLAGYGIGQLSALHAAGSISLPDGLYFLSKYAHFYNELLMKLNARVIEQNGMDIIKVRELCTEYKHVYIAAHHAQKECRLSGIEGEMVGAQDQLIEQGARSAEISQFVGLYCPLMKPVQDHMRTYLEKIDFHDVHIPVLATLDGELIHKGVDAREKIMQQIVTTLRWDKAMESVHDWDIVVHIGPGNSLQNLVREYYPAKKQIAVNSLSDVENFLLLLKQQ